jgi:hypothetical protein
MGKIEIEFMRRHVRALRHEAHVAERAGIDDGLEIAARHRIELARLRVVDEVEEAGKAVAQIETAPTAVADVEDATQFGVDLIGIVEIRIFPGDRMSDRRLETAFAHELPLSLPPSHRRASRIQRGSN